MTLSGHRFEWPEAIVARDFGGAALAMQGNAGKVNDLYVSQSRINASAAGAACTYRMRRLAVAAP